MTPDLFGQPDSEAPWPAASDPGKKKKSNRYPKPDGYAARPGTGPAGETCKSCRHLCRRRMSKAYLKWTGGPRTDIRAKSPACRHWEGITPEEQQQTQYRKS